MSNQSGQQHHVQHPHLGNMFPNGTNAHMNPGMHGALGFPGAYNTQMGFHAPQPPQQAYANMAMMGMGAQNVQAQQARLHLQQLQARQVQARAHAQAQAQAQAQAVQAQQAQVQQAQVQQAQAQAQAQLQAQAQAQVQQRPQNQAMINNGAGPSNNPAQAGTSTETMPEQMAASHAKLAGLLALTEQSGPAQSLAVTAAVAPHLPQILALAKSGQLNSQQLNQLKTLVAMVAKHNGKPMPNQLQRPVQNSPQVPGAGGSFPNSPAMMNATPSQPIQQSHLQTANSQSPHLGQNLAPNQSHLGRVQQHAQNQQNPPQPTNHLPTPQQLHFQSQQLAAQNHAHLSQHPQSQQSHLQNQPHLQAQAQAQGSPPAQVIGIKRKAPPGTLSLPPNDLAQQANNANAGPVNGVQGGQANGTQMNGGAQANGFNQPANGVQVNGNHPQQANGAVPQQSGQPAQPTTRQMQAIILGRAKEIARQQGRMDEQSILQIARGLMAKFQQQQMERIKAQQQAQQAAQAQAQAQAQTQGQVAGMPGANLAQTSAQAQPQPPQSQPQPQQQPQPQAPAQVPQQLQQPQILPQQPQPQPTPASSSGQPQTQPQAPVQVPQQPQPQVQQPQAGPSISQPQASGPSLSGNADDSATAPTRPNSDLSMAQINNTSPTEETSPTLQPNTVNAPDAATPSSPHTMNVTNPGPQTWPVPKNLKTFGSFRLGARPTLSQGLPGGPVLGTPSQLLRFGAGDEALGLGIGEAETAEEKEDAGASVVAKKAGSMSEPGVGQPGKRTVQDLVAELDPRVTVDHEMESYLLARADEFIDSVMHFACRIAKHRGSDQVEPRDIQLHLERNHNIRIPGFASDEIRGALSRPSVEVKPKHMGGTDKSKKKKLNPEAAASVRAARVAAVQNARGMGRD